MQFRTMLFATLLGATLFSVGAPAPATSTEEALEASTSSVDLPTAIGGSVMVRQCRSCEPMIVRVEADSRFFLGERQVTLAELHRFLAAGGKHGLTIFYNRIDRSITRVVVRPRSS